MRSEDAQLSFHDVANNAVKNVLDTYFPHVGSSCSMFEDATYMKVQTMWIVTKISASF